MDKSTLITGGAILTALLTEAGKKLVTPLSEQLGLALGDLAGIYRHYQNENLGKVFTKWAEARGEKPPLTQDDIQKVLPLLRLAAEQSDDDLQARWAALLEHTVTSESGSLPSFGQTLSQLTAEEAKFLDRLFVAVTQPTNSVSQHEPGKMPMSREYLITVYDPAIYTGVNPAERRIFKHKMTEEQLANFAKLDQVGLIIQDLERLGIIVQEQSAEPDQYLQIPHQIGDFRLDSSIVGKNIPLLRTEHILRSHFCLSPYGLSFIRAVSPVTALPAND